MPSTVSSQEENVLLLEKSKELTVTLMPVIIFVSFNMTLGMFGNSIVLYYYGLKTKTTPTTCFIVALAAFDLLTCVLSMPMDHADLILYITFDNVPSCKILRYVTFYTTIASGLTLVGIAIDRYRRICWPHSKQFSVRDARIVCTVCASTSALISLPALVLTVVEHVRVIYIDPRNTTYQVNITGYDCKLTKLHPYTQYILAFHIFQFILFASVTVTLAVLYGLIGRQLLKLRRHRKCLNVNNPRINGPSVSTCSSPSTSRRNMYSTDETNIQIETDKTSSHDIADPADESIVSQDLFVELTGDAEFRNPPDDEKRLKTLFSKDCTHILLQYRKETQCSRNNSVAISNLSQKKIKVLRNRRMSWPNQAHQGNPEYSSSTSLKGRENTPSDELINSAWMKREGHQIILPRSRSDCDWFKISTEMHDDSNQIGYHERQTKESKTESISLSRYVKRKDRKQINMGERSKKAGCPTVQSRFETIDSMTVKCTIIMFIVALVFVISFLPYLCAGIWSIFLDGYEVNVLRKEQLVAFKFGNMSYLINASFNPLIYGLFNSEFREFVYKNICCRCLQRWFSF